MTSQLLCHSAKKFNPLNMTISKHMCLTNQIKCTNIKLHMIYY